MLNATNLKDLLNAAKAKIATIETTIAVVSDDDVAQFTRSISSTDANLTLVGVLPSFNLSFKNVDNYRHANKMLFFMLRKFNTKKGNDEFLEVYNQTGQAVMEFEKWLFAETQKFECPALFKDIDFRTFNADPVRDYHGFYGYMISFDLKTK